jgi:ABC-type branched-subunit amino acid transport system ATPase component
MTGSSEGKALLQVQDVFAGYLDSDILKGVNLHVDPGEIVCVIGPNGAGKSTVFKVIYGFLKVRSGQVWFDGQDVTASRPQDMLKIGIAIVPQTASVFPQMTVYENLELGMYLERDRKRIERRIDEIFDLFPHLAERTRQKAGMLSGGERRTLEIGRALMLEPKLLLMDEPSAGLAPVITQIIFHNILRMNRETELTVLMIEQNARQGLQISDRGYVLEMGENRYEGTGEGLLRDPQVQQAYLGARSI